MFASFGLILANHSPLGGWWFLGDFGAPSSTLELVPLGLGLWGWFLFRCLLLRLRPWGSMPDATRFGAFLGALDPDGSPLTSWTTFRLWCLGSGRRWVKLNRLHLVRFGVGHRLGAVTGPIGLVEKSPPLPSGTRKSRRDLADLGRFSRDSRRLGINSRWPLPTRQRAIA